MSHVVVISGGHSLERDVSLRSGRRAADALQELGHQVTMLDPDRNFVEKIKEVKPDFAFIAMHGRGGEDGTLQDILGILKVPYTGSGVHSSAQCLDKHLFKELIREHGLLTPAWHSFTRDAFTEFAAADTWPELTERLGLPLVVKPAREGSSLGIEFAHSLDDFHKAVVASLSYDDRVIIEHYVEGRELAVTVLGPAAEPEVLPAVEIITNEPFYTFRAHYEHGAARMSIPELPEQLLQTIKKTAAQAYSLAGCRDMARVDIILADNDCQILEINTIPGLTETGPARFAAQAAGLDFPAFIDRVISRIAH